MTGLIYFAALGCVLVFTHGHYAAPYAMGLTALHVAFMWREGTQAEADKPAVPLAELLVGFTFVFSLFFAYNEQLLYPFVQEKQQEMRKLLQYLPAVAAALWVPLKFYGRKPGKIAFWALLAGAVVILVWVRWLTLFASPQPRIDVWTSSVAAVNFFLDGKNPYTQQYQDIYAGAYDYIPSFPYLPGYLYWASAFAWVFGGAHDVRISLVAAELLTAGGLFFVLKALKFDLPICALAVLAWLAWPIDLFVLEQAWIDPLLLMGFVGAVWALLKGRWALAGLAFGIACGVKQYAAPGVLLALPFVWKAGGKVAMKRFIGAGAATLGALFAPFLILSPGQFIKFTLFSWADALPRLDSLSFAAFLADKWATKTPEGLTSFYKPMSWLTLLLLIGAGVWTWKKPATVRNYLVASAGFYGLLLLFAKQAFCNYWYFASFFVFVAAFAGLAPGERSQPAS